MQLQCLMIKQGNILERSSSWLVDNSLSPHLGKTEIILFGPPRKHENFYRFLNCLWWSCLKGPDSVKYSEICIDKFLSCENIVLCIIKNVNTRLILIFIQKCILSTLSRKILCSALIHCYVDYACSSMYCGINKQLKHTRLDCKLPRTK